MHSTNEKRNEFLGSVSNILFRNLPQGVQQKVLSQGANLLRNEIIEGNLEPGNQKAPLMIVDNLADGRKALPACQLAVFHLQKHGLETMSATVTPPMPDGSVVTFHCVDPVKGYKGCVGNLIKAGVAPKQGLIMREMFIKCGEGAGYSRLICVWDQDIFPSSNLPHAGDGPVFNSGSPTGKGDKLFT